MIATGRSSGSAVTAAILPSRCGTIGPPVGPSLHRTLVHMPGTALLQTADELAARNRFMSDALGSIARRHLGALSGRAIDVGCQQGAVMALLGDVGDFEWVGVDPRFEAPETSDAGHTMLPGWAHELPFPNDTFDLALLANVYEHIDPDQRDAS